jgi:hypothetical protein
MSRILLPLLGAIAACTPSPRDAAMPTSVVPQTEAQETSDVSGAGHPDAAAPERAARGPSPAPVSAADNPLPARRADSPEEARGRRILSTAFVMVGPDGYLTVELRDGRMLVLRDVTMQPRDYCGAPVSGGSGKARYCGGYAEIVAARPGNA